MRTAIILGTRPEIIKMAPVIRECERRCLDYIMLHTGQHYSYEMDRIFLEELDLREPDYNLDTGSSSHAEQTGQIMVGVERILVKEKPDAVLVQGDTNTVLAGALAASKLHIKIGHIEAGLRSFDRSMPEEINRVVADHLSDYLFAPTEKSKENLQREGIEEFKISITGNTIVDSVYQNLEIAMGKTDALKKLNLEAGRYILVTAHREENVDIKDKLSEILQGLKLVGRDLSLPVIFPMHPRTQKRIREFGHSLDGINVVDPVGFMEFLQLEASAALVMTDSGGVQEETCILGVPCVTLRDSTERPETLDVGSNIIVGTRPRSILEGARLILGNGNGWKNPFGDGSASTKIIDSIYN